MADPYCNPCPVCGQRGSDGFAPFHHGRIPLWRCRECGYVSPGIGPGRWEAPDALAGTDPLAFTHGEQRWRYPHRDRVLGDIARRVARAIGVNGRVVDVGCGDGQFLAALADEGLDVTGIEADAELADYASRQSGGKVIARSADEAMRHLPVGQVDAVTFIHSLEHFPQPLEILREARRVLRPGGWLVIDLPSIRSPHWLAWRATGLDRLIDNAWGVIDEHAGYYTPPVLQRLTRAAGFRTRKLTTGRWRQKYRGVAGVAAWLLDPVLNLLRVGGIFYMGRAQR